MQITEKVLAKAARSIAKDRYRTTSFTMLKEEMDLFFKLCEEKNITTSEALRALVQVFLEENKQC